jgi:hypothetical protein
MEVDLSLNVDFRYDLRGLNIEEPLTPTYLLAASNEEEERAACVARQLDA